MHLRLLAAAALALSLACAGKPTEEGNTAGDCSDEADNDGDGDFDCNDDGCEGSPACEEADADTDADADADTDTDADADSDTDTDADTDTDVDSDTDTDADSAALEGTWVSEGSDLSELFAAAPFEYRQVTATFEGDGDFTVSTLDIWYATTEYSGTFTVDTRTAPASITLQQSAPYTATSVGIWEVGGDDTLVYEVVQTSPDYGFVAPTPDGGFGSSTGPGLEEGANVQVYRQE